MIIKRKTYSALGYIAGAAAGDLVGAKVGSLVGSKIKKVPSQYEVNDVKEALEYDKKLLKKIKSGKSLSSYDVAPYSGTIIVEDGNGVVKKYKDPQERQKLIDKLEKSIQEKEDFLKNKDKKVSNRSKLGGFIGGTLGIGAGLLATKAILKK